MILNTPTIFGWTSYPADYQWSDITVQNCTFDYCIGPTLRFENPAGGQSFLRLNILNNVIAHNDMLNDTTPWPNPWNDADCIAIQNMTDSNIIGNDIKWICRFDEW